MGIWEAQKHEDHTNQNLDPDVDPDHSLKIKIHTEVTKQRKIKVFLSFFARWWKDLELDPHLWLLDPDEEQEARKRTDPIDADLDPQHLVWWWGRGLPPSFAGNWSAMPSILLIF
jgi:hypothetical protein